MTRPGNSRRGESCRIAVRSHLSSTTGYIGPGMLTCMPRQSAHADGDREPHIEEYDAKTNAICDFSHTPPVRIRPNSRPATATIGCECCFIACGLSTPGRRPHSTWNDFPEGKPGW